ncbi:lytic murein transglycosylase [Agrobacterium vitis]|nr:lytic murein transglycosylase [Allorhizobium ampelinum]
MRCCVWLTPLCPAGHLPLMGGDRQAVYPSLLILWARILARHVSNEMGGHPHPISPLEGEMAGKPEGGGATSCTRQKHPIPG